MKWMEYAGVAFMATLGCLTATLLFISVVEFFV